MQSRTSCPNPDIRISPGGFLDSTHLTTLRTRSGAYNISTTRIYAKQQIKTNKFNINGYPAGQPGHLPAVALLAARCPTLKFPCSIPPFVILPLPYSRVLILITQAL